MDVNAQFIHVAKPSSDVRRLSRLVCRAGSLEKVPRAFTLGAQSSVDTPELALLDRRVRVYESLRFVLQMLFVHELPGTVRLDDVGIGVDHGHAALLAQTVNASQQGSKCVFPVARPLTA